MNKHVGVFAYKYTCMSCRWNTENILRRELTQLHEEIDSTLHFKYSMPTRENETLYTHPFEKKNREVDEQYQDIYKRTKCEGENHTEFVYTSGTFVFDGATNRGNMWYMLNGI